MAGIASRGRVGVDLTEGPIFKRLIVFAIPLILTSIIQQLYSMVDLMVIGRYVGSVGTVGVSVGSEFSDLMMPIATAFASGSQIYMAQLVGAKDEKRLKETVGTMLTLMLGLAIVGTVVGVVLHRSVLGWMNCPEEAYEQAASYMIIAALGTPFVFGYNAVCAIMRAMGESKKPLMYIIVAATVNIFADILLVAVFKLEAAGTAIATVLSQLGSFLAAFYSMYKNKEKFDFELKLSYFKINKDALLVILKLSLPQLARSTFVRFSMLWVNSHINAYGLVVSATNSVGNKIQKFAEVFNNGVDSAASAMIGQNLGAKKPDRAKKVTLYTLCLTMASATVVSILALTIPKSLFGIFTKDPEVMEFGVTYLKIMVIHFFSSAFIGPFQAMVTGCGFVSLGFAIGILDGVICKIGLGVLFAQVMDMGAVGYFWGTALSRVLPGLLCFGYFLSGKWRTRKLLAERKK